MNITGFKDKVFLYIFENENDGYLFFDGDVVSKILEIPPNLLMDIMEEFEDKGYFQMLRMAQRKSQLNIKFSGYEVYNKFIEYTSNMSESQLINMNDIDIFISHSSKDADLAQALINLLSKAFHLKSGQIRCTSIPAYKLDAGADTPSALKQQIFSSKIFIGLLTEHSLKSTYVLFELGARWSTNKPLLPLICDPKGASLLESPLNNINALVATNEEELFKFIESLEKHLNVTPDTPSVYSTELKELNRLSLISSDEKLKRKDRHFVLDGTKTAFQSLSTDEYMNAEEIIKRKITADYPDDFDMQIYVKEKQHAALEELRRGGPRDIPENIFTKIRNNAKTDYPDDFDMQLYIEQKQCMAYRKLHENNR